MTEATAAEIRGYLRNRGIDVPERGKLSDDHKATYDRMTGEDQHDGLFPAPGPASGEYDGHVTEADFGPLAADELAAAGVSIGRAELGGELGGQAEELEAERRPRPAAGQDRPRLGMPGRGRRRGKPRPATKKAAPGKRRAERVPTGPFIERAWTELAQAARRIPPIQRVMAAQAPMVGVVLGDAARGLPVVDPMLQWAARGEDRLEAVNGVFGPILWTGLILRFGGFDVAPVLHEGKPVIGQDGEPVVRPVIDPATGQPAWNDGTRVMIGGLRMSLMSWIRISQRHAEEIIARAEEQEHLGAQADALISFILAPPDPRRDFHDMAREARQRVGVFLHGEATGQPDDGRRAGRRVHPRRPGPGRGRVRARVRARHSPLPRGRGRPADNGVRAAGSARGLAGGAPRGDRAELRHCQHGIRRTSGRAPGGG
jgi:hypothetical protein